METGSMTREQRRHIASPRMLNAHWDVRYQRVLNFVRDNPGCTRAHVTMQITGSGKWADVSLLELIEDREIMWHTDWDSKGGAAMRFWPSLPRELVPPTTPPSLTPSTPRTNLSPTGPAPTHEPVPEVV